jgi:hypothetical protein
MESIYYRPDRSSKTITGARVAPSTGETGGATPSEKGRGGDEKRQEVGLDRKIANGWRPKEGVSVCGLFYDWRA